MSWQGRGTGRTICEDTDISKNYDRSNAGNKDSYLGVKIIENEAKRPEVQNGTLAYSTSALRSLICLEKNP